MDIHEGEWHAEMMNAQFEIRAMPRPPIGSIVQAVAVLRLLGDSRNGAGVTAIARKLNIGPSSCFNVLKTLVAEDLVTFDPVAKTYTLGLGTIDLARRSLGRNAVLLAADVPMASLAEDHDAAVGLWRLAPDERLVLAALAESGAATRIHMMVGQRQPAAAGATGRAVLAARSLDDAAVRAAHAGLRWQNGPSATDYLEQVRQAEVRGFAIDIVQINRGIATVAAVVVDHLGTVKFVLSASMFTGRDDSALQAVGASVHAVATELGRVAAEGASR